MAGQVCARGAGHAPHDLIHEGRWLSAALETASDGITINAIMPGNILTEGLAEQGEDYLGQMRAAIPLQALASPEDLGYAACFPASREAGYITGQTLVVDGGQVLPESPDALANQ